MDAPPSSSGPHSTQRIAGPYRVYIGLVPTGYLSPDAIDQTIRDGMLFCGVARQLDSLAPGAKILVKPNVIAADPRTARYAYTHPEIARGTIAQLLAYARGARINIVEGATESMPAHRVFQKAHGHAEPFRLRGYYELEHLYPGRVSVTPGDESRRCRYQLSKGPVLSANERRAITEGGEDELEKVCQSRFSNEVLAPRHYFESQFSVYCPKFKSDVLSHGFSGAVKLGATDANYGVFDDLHITDMLEVCNPRLIVSDGIVAAVGGNPTTQRGHELGVILVANNALAHDFVAAQILNLDPLKIAHLRIATERGWGPLTPQQIELGGGGADAIRQLSQKSRFWDLGFIPVQEFGDKFERENPGLRFPLQILAGFPYETSGVHGEFLNWLYSTYDFPNMRRLIAKWPKATVCLGALSAFPLHQVVYGFGDRAIASLKAITSSSRRLLRWRGVELQSVQFKNGQRHLLVLAAGGPPSPKAIFLALTLGSLGRMTKHLIRVGEAIDRALYSLRRRWRASQHEATAEIIMTARLAQNDWWALRKNPDSAPRRPSRVAPGPGAFLS